MRSRATADVSHYLLTVDAGTVHLHGYLMCDDYRYVAKSIESMVDTATGHGLRVIPIVLATHLSDGVDIVREVIGKHSKLAQRLIGEARDFHFSAFILDTDDPDDARLMELH